MTRALLFAGLVGLAGTVTHKGKPVAWGSVSLVAADGSAHSAELGRDGRFSVANVPTGPARVGVSSPDPYPDGRKAKYEGRYKPPADLPDGAWFPLPAQYADPQKSGLTLQVGGSPADLDLK